MCVCVKPVRIWSAYNDNDDNDTNDVLCIYGIVILFTCHSGGRNRSFSVNLILHSSSRTILDSIDFRDGVKLQPNLSTVGSR